MMKRLCAIAIALALTAAPASADDSLFEKQFGGKEGMRRIVNAMMVRVLADPRLHDFFADIDRDRTEGLLAEQFCELLEGPCKYSGKPMREVHKDLAIRAAHFNALTEHLQVAMSAQGVPTWAQNRLVAKLAPMQRDIVKPPK